MPLRQAADRTGGDGERGEGAVRGSRKPIAYEVTDQGRALNASYQRGYRDGHKAAMETVASLVKSLANADSTRYLPPDVAAVMFPDKEVK